MVSGEYNNETPLIMHIDLNSCFASIEQQSRPLLRGRPVAIVNRATEHTALVTASYEAKALGVQPLMRLRDARRLAPHLVAIESDPPKYRYVYRKLLSIMQDYSAHVTMKSIDEGIIDFHQAPQAVRDRGLEAIGHEIKQRLRDEVGIAMRCNVGIAPNRFLAKTAAGLHKPDGLDVITPANLRAVFASLQLTKLNGIASRNEARLNAVGIYTPLDFLAASEETLRKVVFKSIDGTKWYKRLRGWEVDDITSRVGRVGRQYVLERFDLTHDEVLQRLHHLSESVGWRMRKQGLAARGVYVYAKTADRKYWHACRIASLPFYSNAAIYETARQLFLRAPSDIHEIGIHCYELVPMGSDDQISLFADTLAQESAIVEATDSINERYGERTIVSADTINTGIYVSQKIPFGSTRYL
jgi:DNA polymerase-4